MRPPCATLSTSRADGRQSSASRRDPGPAGRRLLAWRALMSASLGRWRTQIERAAEVLEIPRDDVLQAAIEAAATCADSHLPAPFAAARASQLARRALAPAAGAAGEFLAAWLADTVLALKLKWPFALPLIAEPLSSAAARPGPARRSAGRATPRSCLLTRGRR